MTRIYDSRTQKVAVFEPLLKGKVSMYVCGPTVQSSPHVGHLRSAVAYDVWRRWFISRGYDVTFVRNVTDIDDKVLLNAVNEPWWALAYRIEKEFTSAYNSLGVLAPTYEPRATGSIPDMIDLIENLIQRGHAYQSLDGSANVYFDVSSWGQYGALTRQSPQEMEADVVEERGKRSPNDFALWKETKAGEPGTASWASPWGFGRPGWHIECSAMAKRYLGDEFDIHGGGLDLRFPHHENELAQSQAAGMGFANLWSHNGLVNVDGEKMAKSKGNSVFAADLLDQVRPIVIRYFLLASHYRSTIDLRTDGGRLDRGSLAEAETAFSKLEKTLERAGKHGNVASGNLPATFVSAMEDDLSTPEATAIIHNTSKAVNAALDGGDAPKALELAGELLAMLEVLGLNPHDETWGGEKTSSEVTALHSLVESLLSEREIARQDKDWASSDRIRDMLAGAGIAVEDGKAGSGWRVTD